MLKKFLYSFIGILLVTSTVSADNTNIGLKISYGDMSATGSHTTNSASSNAGGPAVNLSDKANFPFGSIFIERQVNLGNMDIALGLDINPFAQEVDKLGGGDGFDATVDMGNLYTLYLQPMFKSGNATFFAKAGYAQAEIDIKDISRQATGSGAGGTASTDGNQNKDLEGPMFGIGFQVDTDSSAFFRLEATRTDFDQISHTNSNGKVLKADAELDAISISIGRSF